eukprot:Skav227022  [mRNA]  locus=scaffold456:179512:194390:+ [translate_table: standard]
MTLRLLISIALCGATLASQCVDGNCDDDNVLMQKMDQFHKSISAHQHQLISDKIEQAFAHIKGDGTYLGKSKSSTDPEALISDKFSNITGLGGFNPHDVKEDATWQKCTDINWTKVAGEHDSEGKLQLPAVQMMLEELELGDHCACPGPWCDDDTCKAVFAAIDVFIELCNSEFDPAFANYSVTTWGYYPSWVVGTVEGLDYSNEMPVKVTLKHPKGVCGYAVCDLIRTILTQSANQMMTGTCSYVASLAALSKKAPARAIKIATRLFWLGEITPGLKPCPLIYEQQPGLIPFRTQYGWKPSFYSGGAATCHGNSGDCAHASGMPQQNIGLTFSWSQTLISKWMAINWGFCAPDSVRTGVTYPGQSPEDAAMATRNQGGWYNSMVWECQNLFDVHPDVDSSSCRLVMNPLTCALGSDKAALCKEKWSKEPAFPIVNEIFTYDIMTFRSEAYQKGIVTDEGQAEYVLPAIKAKYANQTRLIEYIHLLENLADQYGTSWLRINELSGPPYPSFMFPELNETCNAHINMLIIDATVLQVAFSNPEIIYQLKLQHLPAFGNYGLPDKSYGCNHAVFLSSCDHEANEYKIWTWGTEVTLTREILLGYPTTQRGYETAPDSYVPAWNTGALCAAVIADSVNVH